MNPAEFQEQPGSMREGGETHDISELETLPEVLSFVETDELHDLSEAVRAAFFSGNTELVASTIDRYHILGQAVVDEQSGEDRQFAQIGLCIALGKLHRDIGELQLFIYDLDDAMTYALHRKYDNLYIFLETIKQAVETSSET